MARHSLLQLRLPPNLFIYCALAAHAVKVVAKLKFRNYFYTGECMSENKILSAQNLYKTFSLEAGFFAKKNQNVYAVNDVSFDLARGETLGLVGESGCGKTTTARLLVRMYEATSGKIFYYGSGEKKDGEEIGTFSKARLKEYRQKVKYIFQDPSRSLNPRMSVLSILTDAFKSEKKSKDEIFALASKTIQEVGLSENDLHRHPSEFSGGQRQRISIARGLIMNPEVLICDEVVSALDVSIQGQILKLLCDLRQKKNLSFVFITHDLKVACWFCDTIAVMYRGVVVEQAPAQDLFKTAKHPYTKLLFAGAMSEGKKEKSSLEVKTTLQKENSCPFAHRCPMAQEKCFSEMPQFHDAGDSQKVRCFFV